MNKNFSVIIILYSDVISLLIQRGEDVNLDYAKRNKGLAGSDVLKVLEELSY